MASRIGRSNRMQIAKSNDRNDVVTTANPFPVTMIGTPAAAEVSIVYK